MLQITHESSGIWKSHYYPWNNLSHSKKSANVTYVGTYSNAYSKQAGNVNE